MTKIRKGDVYRIDEEYETDAEVLGFFRGHIRFRVLLDGQERASPLKVWRHSAKRYLCDIETYKKEQHAI